MERETGGSGERGGSKRRHRSRGLRIRALQILFVREPATRNRLRGVGALLRVTFAVRRTFSGMERNGRGKGGGGATSQVHDGCKGLTSEVTDWQVVTSLFDEKTPAECL